MFCKLKQLTQNVTLKRINDKIQKREPSIWLGPLMESVTSDRKWWAGRSHTPAPAVGSKRTSSGGEFQTNRNDLPCNRRNVSSGSVVLALRNTNANASFRVVESTESELFHF